MSKRFVKIDDRRVAALEGEGFIVSVNPFPCCTLGEYLTILIWLDEQGFVVR